jgi:hypothetical protein
MVFARMSRDDVGLEGARRQVFALTPENAVIGKVDRLKNHMVE